jgi:hypothetical protein
MQGKSGYRYKTTIHRGLQRRKHRRHKILGMQDAEALRNPDRNEEIPRTKPPSATTFSGENILSRNQRSRHHPRKHKTKSKPHREPLPTPSAPKRRSCGPSGTSSRPAHKASSSVEHSCVLPHFAPRVSCRDHLPLRAGAGCRAVCGSLINFVASAATSRFGCALSIVRKSTTPGLPFISAYHVENRRGSRGNSRTRYRSLVSAKETSLESRT